MISQKLLLVALNSNLRGSRGREFALNRAAICRNFGSNLAAAPRNPPHTQSIFFTAATFVAST